MQILTYIHRPIRLLIFAAFVGAGFGTARAQTLVAPEYKLKAAFLYNFAKLAEWPTNVFNSSQTPITIGIVGKDPFGRILEDTVSGKIIHGRKIAIKRFDGIIDDIAKCHLLFIATSQEEQLHKILALVAKRPVLTVSEIDRFNYKGGMIWLIKKGDEIKFRIRRTVVHEAELTLSSKLLALSINAKPQKKENQ